MALEAYRAFCSVFPVTCFPVSRVRSDPAAFVALHTDIAVWMTARTGLQVAPGFCGMIGGRGRRVLLIVGPEHHVRLDLQAPLGESVVALAALFLLVTAVALLGIAGCLERVNADKIASVAARGKIAPGAFSFEISADAAAFMTVETVGLLMALSAVVDRLTGNSAMASDPVAVMIGGDPFSFVTGVALADF